jgi:hypothetical protein
MKLALLAFVAAVFSSTGAAAQCAQWSAGLARPSTPLMEQGITAGNDLDAGVPGRAQQIAAFDDGGGQRLYTLRQRFYSSPSLEVVRWDGRKWEIVLQFPGTLGVDSALGPLVSMHTGVPTLVVLLRTTTPYESTVWNFDGTTWTSLPTLPFPAITFEALDLGSGPMLFASGRILSPSHHEVHVWNGASWTQFGSNLGGTPLALATHDDGNGVQLYVGGTGQLVPNSGVARWNGLAWQAVGTSVGSSLCEYAGDLYLGWSGLRKLVAGVWTAVPSGPSQVHGLATYDHGAGPRLAMSTPSSLLSYDGSTFTALASGSLGARPVSFASVTGPGGTIHYVCAAYSDFGGIACLGLASTDGTTWSTIGRGFDTQVNSLARHSTTSGEELLAAGDMLMAGVTGAMAGVARWDGSYWYSVSPLPPSVSWMPRAIRSIDLGSGPEIYLAVDDFGATWNVHRLAGPSWSALPQFGGPVHALESWSQSGVLQLVAGGTHQTTPNGASVKLFDGNTWQPLAGGPNGTVLALANFDEGSGERLFAGGAFNTTGGGVTGALVRWDGSTWSTLGPGITGQVRALQVFDDTHGAQLYVAGTSTHAGALPLSNLARWNGSTWSDVPGGGPNGTVFALCVHDDGRGPALYVGGSFNTCGGITAYSLARFDGANWEAVDGGIGGTVYALANVDDDGDGDRELFVGGRFQETATVASANIARLEGCPHSTSFCAGDGQYLDHTTPCPCGNDGAPGRGCASSFVADGALLEASGSTANDTLVLHVIDTPQSSLGIYLQHDAQDDRVFHDGVLCASGNLIRLRRHFSVGGESMFPDSTDTATIAQRGSVTPGSGATRYYSCFYRNASTTFCPPATANVSNGIRVIW